MAFLSTTSLDTGLQRFELQRDETTIGRHPDCGIVVDAGAVSRFHAKVIRQGDTFLIADSNSRNGTFLNGQLLTAPQSLHEGDCVRISDVDLIFHEDFVPEFARPNEEMSFDGSRFGILMVDEPETESIPGGKVEFSSSDSGLKMSATPAAKLAALMKINNNLSGALALDDVLPKVLDSLFEIFPAADRGFVVMESPGGTLVPKWVKVRHSRDETETIRISRTIVHHVMDTGTAVLSLDAMDDSRFDSSESIADFSIRSMICAPLQDGDGNSIGALQIDSTKGRGQFRDDDVDLLSGVAAQASVIINNARMHEQALAQQEVEQDLKLAIDVQKAFLPQSPPKADGYRVSSFYQAAHHIGGDYFDYIHLPGGRVAVVVADVVGHGVAAAMYMAKLSAETRFCLASDPDLARAVQRLNDRMSQLHVERFVTFLLVVIDPGSDKMMLVNAGHMSPIVRRAADGSIEEPGQEESGLPIAISEGMEYEAVGLSIDVGDLIVLYTDGVNEAMNVQDEEFTIEPIRRLVSEGGEADAVRDRIVKSVFEHIGDAVQIDDMCLVVIERLTPQQTAESAEDTQETSKTSPPDRVTPLAE